MGCDTSRMSLPPWNSGTLRCFAGIISSLNCAKDSLYFTKQLQETRFVLKACRVWAMSP